MGKCFGKGIIKLIIVIVEEYHCYYVKNFIQYSFLKVNSIRRHNYWGSHRGFRRNRSTTGQVFCIHHVVV
jgi:hypothetical protein